MTKNYECFLDPFSMPPETRGRFYILMVMAVVLAWNFPTYFLEVPLFFEHLKEIDPEIIAILRRAADDFDVIDTEELRKMWEWVQENPHFGEAWRNQVLRSIFSLAVVGTLSAGATGLFWIFSTSPRYRFQLLLPSMVPSMFAELKSLIRRLGIKRIPELRCKPGFLDGRAFGPPGREVMVLSGDPRWIEKSWNDLSRAVMLHELGHVVNGDGHIRDIARSLWSMLAILFVVSTVGLSLSEHSDFPDVLVFFIRILIVFLAAWGLWADLVRDREFYADWRVVSWGFGGALARRLSLAESYLGGRNKERSELWKTEWYWLRRWFRLFRSHHPSNTERLRILEDPRSLFTLSPKLALLTGFMLAFFGVHLGPFVLDLFLISGLLGAPFMVFLPPTSVAVITVFSVLSLFFLTVTHLLTRTLGTQALRVAIADLLQRPGRSWAYGQLIVPALAFAAGLEMGFSLWTATLFSLEAILRIMAWALGFAFLIWMWLAHAGELGRRLMRSRTERELPKMLVPGLRGFLTFQLTLLIWPTVLARLLAAVADRPELLAGPGEDPGEIFRLLSIGTVGLLLVVLTCFLGSSLVVYLAIALWERFHKHTCTRCGQAIAPGPVVGISCSVCDAPLAPWLIRRPLALKNEIIDSKSRG